MQLLSRIKQSKIVIRFWRYFRNTHYRHNLTNRKVFYKCIDTYNYKIPGVSFTALLARGCEALFLNEDDIYLFERFFLLIAHAQAPIVMTYVYTQIKMVKMYISEKNVESK